MAWNELAVASRYPAFVEELLQAAGAQAIRQLDGADHPLLEPAPGDTPLWPHTVTIGLFETGADLDHARTLLVDCLPDDDRPAFEVHTVEERDWVGQWLQYAQPLRFGKRLWVCPGGHRVAASGAVVVHLDPGLAFGTGSHPSTGLCLEWLAENDCTGLQVLDYGCGSGILGIAALKLGARQVLATDIDPQALLATVENAGRNGVAERLHALLPEDLPAQPVDLLLANILAGPLIELAPRLSRSMTPDGRIVLAGLLARQAREVRKAYATNFDFDASGEREGWVRLSGRRRSI